MSSKHGGKGIWKLQLQAAESSRTCPIRSGGNGQHPTALAKYRNYLCLAESTCYYWVLFGPGSFCRKKVAMCSYPYPDSCMNHICLMGWSLNSAMSSHANIPAGLDNRLMSAMSLGITGVAERLSVEVCRCDIIVVKWILHLHVSLIIYIMWYVYVY